MGNSSFSVSGLVRIGQTQHAFALYQFVGHQFVHSIGLFLDAAEENGHPAPGHPLGGLAYGGQPGSQIPCQLNAVEPA